MRLGNSAQPLRYAAELTIVPGHDTFSGTADIDLKVNEPVQTLWLNATQLNIQEATLDAADARVVPGNASVAGFSVGRVIAAGEHHLRVRYEGKISRRSSAGMFQLQADGRWYVYTQFEPTDARRVFPCFDEPGFKAPWQLTLVVPKDQMALANAPETSQSEAAGEMKRVRFETTRPLPSYLVALAVGPFDAVDAGKAGRTPLRIIVPKGRAGEAKYAAETIPQLLRMLEHYFGTPFPYPKLDSVVMPISNFAMENAGLITYGASLLLARPESDTIGRQRSCAVVTAHEMAHQWFGDLVTTAWWDDIWLNEAFATWMESKIVDEWKPGWRMAASDVQSRLGAMENDSLVSARKIRQPIESDNDIANAFDGITYEKGAAVIRMFESWVGAATFRKGVQLYLRQHADGNATAQDFLAAIGTAAKKDVAKPFSTFLDQAGVPEISVAVECDGAHPRLELRQQRYLPTGSPGSANRTWMAPVCAKYEAGGKEHTECSLLTDPQSEMELHEARSCPAWVMPNAGGVGYYFVQYGGDMLTRLLDQGDNHLSVAERVSVLGDISAMVNSGELPPGRALGLMPKFKDAPEHEVMSQVVQLSYLVKSRAVPEEYLPNAARFVRDTFGERAHQLGWTPKPGESDNTRLLREELVSYVAMVGEDQSLIEEARTLAGRWLADRKSVDPNLAGPVLKVAARFGDQAFFDRLHRAALAEKDPKDRQTIIGAMASFRNPQISREALALLLTDEFDPRQSFYALLFGPLGYRETEKLPFEFLEQNIDALIKKLPREVGADFAAALPTVGYGFCDASGRAELAAFFEPRVKEYTGGPRNLAQALESVDLCIARKKAYEASLVGFLKEY